MTIWQDSSGIVGRAVAEQNDRLLTTYRADPRRLEEDANTERSICEGAYADRQVFELLQNAADACLSDGGRCKVLLTDRTLYVANTGDPLSVHGVETLMAAHLSGKRDDQIGRFGLGFKSVLAVTDSPRILSTSGSLRFDRQWSRNLLARDFPGRPHYPVTRLAQPVDPRSCSSTDPVVKELMAWATTIVVLPLRGNCPDLEKNLGRFPAEFLLFSDHVRCLEIENRRNNSGRRITLRRADQMIYLDDADRKSTWTVHTMDHRPSSAALRDGGYQAARESLRITWAAPLEGARHRIGRFWAYFPTAELTTLSGIVNAAWKLTDDRASLLPGPFNDEILQEILPRLVVSALPSLCRPERPASVIDVLPARGKEARGYADDVINSPIMKAVANVPCIPNLRGELRHPKRIHLHPENLHPDELKLWENACRDPENWVHHSLNSAEHRAKVLRLLGENNRPARTCKEWLEHLAKDGSVEGSAAAVRLVAILRRRRPELREEVESARVLLLDDGTLHACRRGQVFLPGNDPQPGRLIINQVLAAIPEVRTALQVLGIEIFDNAGELRSELAVEKIAWDRVWSSIHKNSPEEAEKILQEVFGQSLLQDLRVRTYAGHWKDPGSVFLPGTIIPKDCARDHEYVVDHRYHGQDMPLLKRLGLVDQPTRNSSPPMESWRRTMEVRARDHFRQKFCQPRIADESLEIDIGRLLWPLGFLASLSPEGRAAIVTSALLKLSGEEKWTITHKNTGQRVEIRDPTWSLLRQHGYLPTEVGLQPVSRCLPDSDAALIDGVRQPLPFVKIFVETAQAKALGLRTEIDELRTEDWGALIEESGGWLHDRRFLLYTWAAGHNHPAPALIKVRQGRGHALVSPRSAAVTSRQDVFESLLEAQVPAVFALPEDAEILQEKWGLSSGDEMVVESLDFHPSGERVLAVDRFPPLRDILPQERQALEIQPCDRVELLTSTPAGQRIRPLTSRLEEGVLLTTAIQDRDLLQEIGRQLQVRIVSETVLRRMEEHRRDKLRVQINQADDLLDKLLLAIGPGPLREGIPSSALHALQDETGRELTGRDVAQLSLAVDGYEILQHHVRVLEQAGLTPPKHWAGRAPAREWVRRLGFPSAYAGFPGVRREQESEIEGPPELGPLHEYQIPIARRIRGLLAADAEIRRGLVPLPTGAGKTRVAVEALVGHIVDHVTETQRNVRIVWLAETDELCEQAARTWSVIWRAQGVPGSPLTLNRLWGNNNADERDGVQVVIASIDKLNSIMGGRNKEWQEDYGWLRRPAVVVIDEAHRSIAPKYNHVLSNLGDTENVSGITTPLLGLTATPFRGFNDEETRILADRYHRNLLDEGVFPNGDAYAYLQENGYLARVRHERLPGSDVTFTESELADALKWHRFPDTAEKRLGQDEKRNNDIVRSIRELDHDASVLLFATSVENARVLAALLTYHGIEARAVSSDTGSTARRRYVEDFAQKRVRVLTNYIVFTEGFDVPEIDAVYITRPTFSPNIYQQMVGRGLRGPRNGGKETVRIVDVADNLSNFGDKLAFHHFDRLWGRQYRGQ